MGVDWKGLIVGGLGVVALFTGADYLTKKSQSKSFNAEDWNCLLYTSPSPRDPH